ncbi:hypothetical protein Sjap_022430 [Stephania japonica]|uniref:Uncharacterized protein n=1 Tax=Stephania japonica TaxID=461633 RepID=A0AAP0EUK3_9MAGN
MGPHVSGLIVIRTRGARKGRFWGFVKRDLELGGGVAEEEGSTDKCGFDKCRDKERRKDYL